MTPPSVTMGLTPSGLTVTITTTTTEDDSQHTSEPSTPVPSQQTPVQPLFQLPSSPFTPTPRASANRAIVKGKTAAKPLTFAMDEAVKRAKASIKKSNEKKQGFEDVLGDIIRYAVTSSIPNLFMPPGKGFTEAQRKLDASERWEQILKLFEKDLYTLDEACDRLAEVDRAEAGSSSRRDDFIVCKKFCNNQTPSHLYLVLTLTVKFLTLTVRFLTLTLGDLTLTFWWLIVTVEQITLIFGMCANGQPKQLRDFVNRIPGHLNRFRICSFKIFLAFFDLEYQATPKGLRNQLREASGAKPRASKPKCTAESRSSGRVALVVVSSSKSYIVLRKYFRRPNHHKLRLCPGVMVHVPIWHHQFGYSNSLIHNKQASHSSPDLFRGSRVTPGARTGAVDFPLPLTHWATQGAT
ncbi:hypothetical protein BDP27DRAFT_1368401 [Rhodocollybia butyracea]|uniref:Uncharacterized protein n=1 Tax=Rhodocollybia butyracea TaxID=206335 RepID=A0A9P5PGV1_9AGAR|nr:hypothetical protein BDP27DRAFT_1368401 [Rhodocollybia butyracea]